MGRSSRSRLLLLAATVVTTLHGGVAEAQSAVDRARDAFARGLAAEEQGQPAEACEAFRESLSLVRELGPLRKTAACDEREGRLGRAAAALEEVLRGLPADDPERVATETTLAGVRARMARVVIAIRPDAPAGLTTRIEGRPLDQHGGDVLLDPGSHDVVVDVPGAPSRVVRLALAEGETVRLELPPDEHDARVLPPATPRAMPSAPPPPRRSGAMRSAGWVVSGIGLAGILGAATTGVALVDDHGEIDACNARPGCDPLPLARSADSLIVVNAVAWGVGVLGVGVGTTLLVLDASSDDGRVPGPSVQGAVGPGGASVRGRF